MRKDARMDCRKEQIQRQPWHRVRTISATAVVQGQNRVGDMFEDDWHARKFRRSLRKSAADDGYLQVVPNLRGRVLQLRSSSADATVGTGRWLIPSTTCWNVASVFYADEIKILGIGVRPCRQKGVKPDGCVCLCDAGCYGDDHDRQIQDVNGFVPIGFDVAKESLLCTCCHSRSTYRESMFGSRAASVYLFLLNIFQVSLSLPLSDAGERGIFPSISRSLTNIVETERTRGSWFIRRDGETPRLQTLCFSAARFLSGLCSFQNLYFDGEKGG